MTSSSFTIRSVQAFGYRYPLTTDVITSFGRMADRPAVFVRVEDTDGYVGWGEVWCNFPAPGAEHRVRLVNEVLAPALVGFKAQRPSAAFERLTQGTSVLALQSGEAGPFAQAIAGIDLAIWDLHARRQNVALWKLLGGSGSKIKVYASGINPAGSERAAEAALARGYRALKLKIGFDPVADRANLAVLRRLVGEGLLAADVNQGWTIAQALELAPQLEAFGLGWLEEPIRADRPQQEWKELRQKIGFPLAAGENIASHAGFAEVLGERILGVVQPDIAKWGGLSACPGTPRDIL
jgi:D-galactarolactone cycloisomerase